MIEINLLKAFADKAVFDKYRHLLNPASLSIQSKLILKDYEVYFQTHETYKIDFSSFSVFFFNERNPYLDNKSIIEYKDILERIAKADITEDISSLIRSFEQQEFYRNLQVKIDRNVDIITVKQELDDFIDKTSILHDSSQIEEMDLKASLTYTDRSNGLQWRCNALRKHFNGGLIKSDFGIIAGFVDSGKTSFIASEISFMGQQIGKDDYILWLSNEGDYKSILPRLYCATLNCTDQDLRKHQDSAILKYKEKMHGDSNRIVIKDIQGWAVKDIEKAIKKRMPRLLVIDLLDHVSGFNSYNSKEQGSFEVYNKLYQWGREIATKYCPVLGVSQMNGDGEDEMYPSMSKLRGSRVDKQAAATFQLMIGSIINDNTVRYLSMPKNKINNNRGWKVQVRFDAQRSRFI